MKTFKHASIALALMLAFSSHVSADPLTGTTTAVGVTCDPNDAECLANCQNMETTRKLLRQQLMQRYTPPSATDHFSKGSCLDVLMNTKINITFSVAAADAIIAAILNAIKNAACQAVMGAWQQSLGKVNAQLGTAVSLPVVGQVAGVGTSVGPSSTGGGVIGVNGNGVQNIGTYNSGTATAAQQQVQGAMTSTTQSVHSAASGAASQGSGVISTIKGLFN